MSHTASHPNASPDDQVALPLTQAAPTLPHWNTTAFFPSLDSPEFGAAFDALVAEIAALETLWDAENIAARTPPAAMSGEIVRAYEAATRAYNALLDKLRVVSGYVYLFITTDSRNALAQARRSDLQKHLVTLGVCGTRYTAFLGSLDADALLAASAVARDHEYYLREAKIAAAHQMSPAEEALSAALYPGGGSAWSRLYSDLCSQMTVPFTLTAGGETAPQPMSVIRALSSDADADTRERAYHAEIAAWEASALPLVAALNSLKYETATLAKRRGWNSPLDAAAFHNHIDRETLDAMLSAARKSFPAFRGYLKAKAKLLPRGASASAGLAWYDLFAPVAAPGTERAFPWRDAEMFVAEQFGAYSPKLRAFAERAFRESWIDAEPRAGKQGGAFCMGLSCGTSRILQNYRPSLDAVSTLAHELGHGYHNLCLADRLPLQRATPMTLAETASIFCETIITEAALASAGEAEQLTILETRLQGACQVVVDITSRFLFERGVFERRQERELSVAELCDLMTQAQRDTYGDGLDERTLHPYMWAAKGHYYGSTFYNFPYMFGLLFGTGLYAQYQAEPAGFHARYDELLSLTGMSDAATLGERFGINIRDEAFWTSSLDLIGGDITRFTALAAKGAA